MRLDSVVFVQQIRLEGVCWRRVVANCDQGPNEVYVE
jgi:hypothetical protein